MAINFFLALTLAFITVYHVESLRFSDKLHKTTMSQAIKRIVLDVDVGIDDAYALLYFLYAEKLGKVKIEAITCSRGNTNVENVSKNLVRLLEIVGRTDIPVYKGAFEALVLPVNLKNHTHFGLDGFGDLDHEKEPNVTIIQKEPAAVAMRNIVIANPKQITLVCLAPLTNIALASKLYDDFIPNVGEIFIMGGNYKGIGNTETTAEFNFYEDPEAAYTVLRQMQCPMIIFTYEAGKDTNISMDWRFNVLSQINTPFMKLLNAAEEKIHKNEASGNDIWYPFDGFTAVVVVSPNEMISRKSNFHVSVELTGSLTRGQMVLSHSKNKEPNAIIIEEIDYEYYKKIILEAAENI